MSDSLNNGRLHFADKADLDRFVDMLERYERGEISAENWRSFRLLNGVYGQRQPGQQMFRVKIPQGILSAQQLLALARVAEACANGRAHVTTRQNIQFYGLSLQRAPEAMNICASAGLTTKEACGHSVRNITANPLAGVDKNEIFDVSLYAEAATRFFLRGPLSSSLPRKFKIAFEGSSQDVMRAGINDLSFLARRDEHGRLGFRVLVGGGTSTLSRNAQTLFDFLVADELLGAALAVLKVFHRDGERNNKAKARIKWLIKSIGFEEFRNRVLASFDEIKREGIPQLSFNAQEPPAQDLIFREPEPPVPVSEIPFSAWKRTNVVEQKQIGRSAVVVTLTLGDLSPKQLRALAALSERFSDGTIRTTIEQNILFRNIASDSLSALYTELKRLQLADPGAATFADVTTCAGAHTCAIAVTASRGMAELISNALENSPAKTGESTGLLNATVKVSGCPNGCGQHHIATIGLQGAMRKVGGRALPLYQLTVGGGTILDKQGLPTGSRFGKLVGKVPARRVPQAIERILSLWEQERTAGESLDLFLARVHLEKVKSALTDIFDISEATATELDYIDPGQDEPFSVSEGEAECAM